MPRVFWSWGLGTCGLVIAILVAKAQQDPRGLWGFLLKDPHVVPLLFLWATLCFLVGLGQWKKIRDWYWSVFAWLFPADGRVNINDN